MKKIYLVVQNDELVAALESLRDLGVVHVEHGQAPEGGMISHYQEDIRKIEQALVILNTCGSDGRKVQTKTLNRVKTNRGSEVKQTVQEILHIQAEIESLEEGLGGLDLEIERVAPWGHFNPADIMDLRRQGVHISLAVIPDLKKIKLPAGVMLKPVGDLKAHRYLVITRGETNLPFETVDLPKESLRTIQDHRKRESERLKILHGKLHDMLSFKEGLDRMLADLVSKLSFERVVRGTQAQGEISVLKGFCPEENIDDVTMLARDHRWGFLVQEPSPEDQPPTLLQNPKWIQLIKPVFALMNIVPGYNERDVSPFFLVFLSIFFGMLIGDAGYGLMFIAVTFWAQKKFGDKVQDHSVFHLIYVLSSFAVIWGFLTGTFFGTVLFGRWIKPLVPWLTDNNNIQLLCFLIGGAHLTLAHAWRAISKWMTVGVLAEIGWISIVWASFFFAREYIIGVPKPGYMNAFWIGPALVICFNQPRKNIFAGIGLGLSDFLLNVMNFFGDVVSYIRLFAVGLAGVAVADSFNQMAMSVGFGHPASAVGALMILGAGHLLNMVLSLFAILVHGIRLNVLEFSSHLGMEWTGMPYSPLRK